MVLYILSKSVVVLNVLISGCVCWWIATWLAIIGNKPRWDLKNNQCRRDYSTYSVVHKATHILPTESLKQSIFLLLVNTIYYTLNCQNFFYMVAFPSHIALNNLWIFILEMFSMFLIYWRVDHWGDSTRSFDKIVLTRGFYKKIWWDIWASLFSTGLGDKNCWRDLSNYISVYSFITRVNDKPA